MTMPTRTQIIAEITAQCSVLHLDAATHVRQCQAESAFNQGALSSCGAIGLFQLEPATAADLHVDPHVWQQNVQGGLTYMKQLYTRYRDISKALAAYNWGIGHLDKCLAAHGAEWANHLPIETSNYLKRIERS